LGEKVVVWGQGIVGLLTTSILAQFPLKSLVTLDLFRLRRQMSQKLGAQNSFDPDCPESLPEIESLFQNENSSGADLIFETSGNPEALNKAIEIAGFDGRIIVGSWYGTKEVKLNLGEGFHRNRVQLVSSQVSTVAPYLQGRWNKSRRFETVWNMIEKAKPSQFVTQIFPVSRAAEAYRLLDENPGDIIQVIFSYEDCG
jgi:threonine dehydrogenase-like Zn-dependent dehydrogenase